MLQRLRFKGAAVDDRLALGVFLDAVADGFLGFFRRSKLERPTLARVRDLALDSDTILSARASAIPP